MYLSVWRNTWIDFNENFHHSGFRVKNISQVRLWEKPLTSFQNGGYFKHSKNDIYLERLMVFFKQSYQTKAANNLFILIFIIIIVYFVREYFWSPVFDIHETTRP